MNLHGRLHAPDLYPEGIEVLGIKRGGRQVDDVFDVPKKSRQFRVDQFVAENQVQVHIVRSLGQQGGVGPYQPQVAERLGFVG